MSKGFREIGGSKKYRAWALWLEEDYIVGKFVGTSTDKYGKTSWHIAVDETNIEFDSAHGYTNQFNKWVPDVEIVEGETIALNSNGGLDHKMEQTEQGEIVKIIYNGMKPLTKGPFAGKECHDVSVLVAEDGDEEAEGAVESFTQL